MSRNRTLAGSLAVVVIALASCSSSGPKTQSEDDFIASMNTVCTTANNAIAALDPTAATYVASVIKVVDNTLDSLLDLKPPKSTQADFNDFTDNLDAYVMTADKLNTAIKSSDLAAEQSAATKLTTLTKKSDDIANSIGAADCVDVGGGDETDDTTALSEPSLTLPATTVPATTLAPTTVPVTTAAPTTVAATPTTPTTTPDSSGSAAQSVPAADHWTAPPGYTWEADAPTADTPAADPVLGPLLKAYYAGTLQSTTTPTVLAPIFIIQLNQDTDWTDAQLKAYYEYEQITDAADVTTPLGLDAKSLTNVDIGGEVTYDIADIVVPGAGVLIGAPTGTDVLALIDAFYSANTMAS
ncbi:MAG TPA: hypothetical protein VGM78_04625 [Ilumatobacteraceae bacterium]